MTMNSASSENDGDESMTKYDENDGLQENVDLQKDLFLTFRLQDEDYGLPISYVTEIIGIPKITTVPDMPHYIKGVINLRGRVIPAMDVRLCFGLCERAYDDRTCVIVVDVNDQTTGLVVDRVNEVVEIGSDQIEPPPHHGAGSGGYIQGMGKIGDEVKILLDIDALVGSKTAGLEIDLAV
jgi:purine-binding chemotaxis protein CheW